MQSVGIVTEDGIDLSHWHGVADRRILRLVPGLKSVLLDIEAWRTMILEPYKRLGPDVYMVVAFIGDGRVVGVMEGRANGQGFVVKTGRAGPVLRPRH